MKPELAFRAQLILREQREIYDYWRSCAKSRSIPKRSDIDPVAVPQLLPNLSILDWISDTGSVQYRLAGTNVCRIFGRNITGLDAINVADKPSYWKSVYDDVILDGLPMQGVIRGASPDRDHLLLFWLRLPLADENGRVEKILGYDATLPISAALFALHATMSENDIKPTSTTLKSDVSPALTKTRSR